MDHLQSSSPIGSPAEVGMGGPSASVGDADNTTPKVGGGPNQLLQHDSSQVIHTTANPNRLKIEVMTPNLGENVVINVDVPDGKLESNSPAPFPLDNRNDNLQATPREQSPRGENTSLRIQKAPKTLYHTAEANKNGVSPCPGGSSNDKAVKLSNFDDKFYKTNVKNDVTNGDRDDHEDEKHNHLKVRHETGGLTVTEQS